MFGDGGAIGVSASTSQGHPHSFSASGVEAACGDLHLEVVQQSPHNDLECLPEHLK